MFVVFVPRLLLLLVPLLCFCLKSKLVPGESGFIMRLPTHFVAICFLVALLAFGITNLTEAASVGEDGNTASLDSALLQVEHEAKLSSQRVLGLTPTGQPRQTYGSQGQSMRDIHNDSRQTTSHVLHSELDDHSIGLRLATSPLITRH